MKCSIPEISWHNREPVLSADIQPINTTNNDFYRLATGGSDNLVLIWKLKVLPEGQVDVTVLSELTRHQRSVNVVKWSPDGEMLASADDDANIILWQLKTDNIPSLDEREDEFEEKWNAIKVLRGHKEDVYDLCWSPKSDKLLSGSVDNTAILWDVIKGKSEHIIKDHKGFIQGVAWDPKSDFLATLCSDRVCRVFDRQGRRVRARIGRGKLPVDEGSEFYDKEVKYFHDDTFKTYFRRLDFSPDGSLLLVPSGAVETEERKNALFGTFAFTLDSLANPVGILPSGKQCSIAVKCCPMLYELRENGPKPFINLPYRMIIAVATDSDVILYDTQQQSPCVHLQNIHYTRLTDLTWSIDGLLLAASSTDGFITLITFDEGELGVPYVKEESDVEDSVLNISGCEMLPQDELKVVEVLEVEKPKEKPKKSSFLQQWAKQNPKRKTDETTEELDAKKAKSNSNETGSIDMVVENNAVLEPEVKKKRITPILLSKDVSSVLPVKPSLENKDEVKPKKRIQPIKIGEVAKAVEKVPKKLENPEEKPMVVDEVIVLDEDTPQVEIAKQNIEKVVDPLKIDVLKMPTPIHDLTDKNTPKTEAVSPPGLNKTKPVPKTQTPPSKKKKTPVQPSNTLFKYLKPIIKALTTENGIDEKKDKEQKSEFKPLKLFAAHEEEPLNGKTSYADVKIKVSGLVKAQSKAAKSKTEDLVINSEETTTEIPEDFVLRVDDDTVQTQNDVVVKTMEKEKENEADNEVKGLKSVSSVKKMELDVPKRRIPLITLSSPKNKTKPKTAE